MRYDSMAASDRLSEAYLFVSRMEDLSQKVDGLARMVGLLEDIDPDREMEQSEGLHSLAQQDLESATQQLLDSCADHFEVSRASIKSLARAKPQAALTLCKSLNTEERRDQALLLMVNTLMEQPPNVSGIVCAEQAVQDMAGDNIRDMALETIMRKLEQHAQKMDASAVEAVLGLVDATKQIADAVKRSQACCRAFAFLKTVDPEYLSGLASEMLSRTTTALGAITVAWQKVDVGFQVARVIADHAPDHAAELVQEIDRLRNTVTIDAEESALTYLGCLRLAIRAYGGLLTAEIATTANLERLGSAIDRLPADGERAGLWAELAIRCFSGNDLDKCRQMVNLHVRPLVEGLPVGDQGARARVLIATAPAIYAAYPAKALEMISDLPDSLRDEAYSQICRFILTKQPVSEPAEPTFGVGHDLTLQGAEEICSLMELMTTDISIFICAQTLADCICRTSNKIRFTREAKYELADHIEGIVPIRLPDKKNIAHDGYVVVMKAQAARIRNARIAEWDALLEKAREIPNAADKALVLYTIAIAMRKRPVQRSDDVLDEAYDTITALPTAFQRMTRYANLASSVLVLNRGLARKSLRAAMEASVVAAGSEATILNQHQIIDMAYRVDPDFAENLVTLFDADSARARARAELREQLVTLKFRDQMADTGDKPDPGISNKDLPRSAWLLLAGLNSGTKKHQRVDSTTPYVIKSAELPFSQAYPVLAWRRRMPSGVTPGHLRREDTSPRCLKRQFKAATLPGEWQLVLASN